MILYPALDFMNGRCVRLYKGEKSTAEYFDLSPVEWAVKWELAGAKALHLIDLDGAFTGIGKNLKALKAIRQAVKIPINIGGGIRNSEQAEKLIREGFNVILGTMLLNDLNSANELLPEWRDNMIVAVDCRDDMVTGKGWTEISKLGSGEYIKLMKNRGFKKFLYTDVETDGTLQGPNFARLIELSKIPEIQLIASGGVGTLDDIKNLKKMGLYGAVVGKGILSKRFTLEEALEVCCAD